MVGVNETESIEAAALSIAGTVGRIFGQVVLHQRERVLHLASVDHAQAGGGRELRPGGRKVNLSCDQAKTNARKGKAM